MLVTRMDEDEVQDKALDAAAVLVERVAETLYRSKGPGEIQPLQWAILRCLSRYGETGLTQSWIAKYLGLTHAPVSRAVSTLTKRGLIEQQVQDSDGRSKILILSISGQDQMQYDPLKKLANTMRQIDQRDFLGFSRSLEKLVINFDNEQ